jgi:hypothetical protein
LLNKEAAFFFSIAQEIDVLSPSFTLIPVIGAKGAEKSIKSQTKRTIISSLTVILPCESSRLRHRTASGAELKERSFGSIVIAGLWALEQLKGVPNEPIGRDLFGCGILWRENG